MKKYWRIIKVDVFPEEKDNPVYQDEIKRLQGKVLEVSIDLTWFLMDDSRRRGLILCLDSDNDTISKNIQPFNLIDGIHYYTHCNNQQLYKWNKPLEVTMTLHPHDWLKRMEDWDMPF